MLYLMTVNGVCSSLDQQTHVLYMVCAEPTESATPTIFSSAAVLKASPQKTLEPGIRERRGQVAVFARTP